MPLSPGTRLGPYEIVALLGAGGMGEVYKARDTRLDRMVAVKVSSQQFSDRFAREARAVAAFNHPNIVALYDVGDNYIVTELVEGESLRTAKIAPRKAVEIAAQIADGLADAHAAGIIHRDLKPDNVMLTRDGRAKILDFGLSRQYASVGENEHTRTLPGTVMGTVGYMSPEQVRGQDTDPRTDIFSLGVVIYEMLGGKRAFTADTAAEIMTAILKQDPPELPPTVPVSLRQIVQHCMEKEPAARFQSAKDLAFALRSLPAETSTAGSLTPVAAVPANPARRWLPWAAAVAAACAAFVGGRLTNRAGAPDLANYRFTPIASEPGREQHPAWSPDGKTLAYCAMTGSHIQIFTRRLDLPVPDQITHQSENCLTPFFSRNGERIYYRQGGQLWSVATVGGAPQKVLDEVGVFAIAPDGVTTAVARRDAAGSLSFGRLGSKDWKLYKKPPFDQNFSGRAVEFSPDGKKLAILFSRTNSGEGELWLVPYPPESGSPRKLFAGATGATFFGFSWMPDSRRLAVAISQGDEPSQIFLGDAESGTLRKLTAGLEHRAGPAVSPDGSRIAFTQATPDNDVIEVALDGSAVTPILASARSEGSAQWSANGREFIYNSDAGGHAELWARNVDTGRARPLFNRMQELMPAGRFSDFAVAPDGERLAINLSSGGEHTIWLLRQSAGKALRLDPENADHHSPSWSPDGNWIAYGRVLPKEQLMKAPAGGGAPVPVAAIDWLGGPAEVAWSPSGEWIAWAADTITLYSPDGKQQKKLAGAMNRSIGFSRDGKTLYTYYPGPDRGHWLIDAYDVASGQMHRSGAFTLDPNTSPRGFSLHPDGKRFLATLIKDNLDIVLLQGF